MHNKSGGTGAIQLSGAVIGFNKDSQYNVFVQDGDFIFTEM